MVFPRSCCLRPARKPVVKARCLSAYLLACSLLLTLCPVGKVANKGVGSWPVILQLRRVCGRHMGPQRRDRPTVLTAGSGVWTQITAQTLGAAPDAADGALRSDIKLGRFWIVTGGSGVVGVAHHRESHAQSSCVASAMLITHEHAVMPPYWNRAHSVHTCRGEDVSDRKPNTATPEKKNHENKQRRARWPTQTKACRSHQLVTETHQSGLQHRPAREGAGGSGASAHSQARQGLGQGPEEPPALLGHRQQHACKDRL